MALKTVFYCSILFVVLSGQLFSQTVFGKVVDGETLESIEFGSVVLYAMPQDSLLTGMLTATNGYFSFNNIPPGKYKVLIRVIGYTELRKEVKLEAGQVKLDLGNLQINPNTELLKEVNIIGEKSYMVMSIDKKSYNVEKDLSVAGGTGLDAIKNIPSVSIDVDGAVTLRNSAVQIFVDGKQSALTLEQIPADQIDRVEVMTNPSAKYDANTSGGILNVILKKNTKMGYNGSVKMGVGTNERYSPSIMLNLKKEKFNFTTSYNYNSESNDNKGTTRRENITNPIPINNFEQTSLTDFRRNFHVGRISVDYFINQRNTISIRESYVNGKYITDEEQNFTAYNVAGDTYSIGERLNYNENKFQYLVTNLDYKKEFPKKGREFTAGARYSYGKSGGNYDFETNNTIVGGSPEIDEQLNLANGSSHLLTLQADYVNPINDSTKLEIGVKSVVKNRYNENATTNLSLPSGDYIYDSLLSNNYRIQEYVNAAYVNYSTKVKNIGMQAGVRFEQVYYSGREEVKSNEAFGYSYPSSLSSLGNAIFPSLFFNRKVTEAHEWQLNFSRKLNRPRFYYLLPIVFFADRYNFRIGNPALEPEFVNKAEINYNYVKPSVNYLTSIFGQITDNSILYGAFPSDDDPNVLINTFQNGGKSYMLGWENSLKLTFWKKLTISSTVTPFYLSVNYLENTGELLQNQGLSLTSKFLVSYNFPKKVTLQVNGLYDAPKPIPQGNKTDLFFFDISLSKKIKRFSATLLLSDVLDTKQRGTVYKTPDYEQFLIRRRSSRFVKLTLAWRFGTKDDK